MRIDLILQSFHRHQLSFSNFYIPMQQHYIFSHVTPVGPHLTLGKRILPRNFVSNILERKEKQGVGNSRIIRFLYRGDKSPNHSLQLFGIEVRTKDQTDNWTLMLC